MIKLSFRQVDMFPENTLSRLKLEKKKLKTKIKSSQLFINEIRVSWNFPTQEIKENFSLHSANKCNYCESYTEGYLDDFRPRSVFTESKEIKRHNGYWWLAFEPENKIFCCNDCNNYKSNYFPVAGKRAKPFTEISEIDQSEERLLINPFKDEIEENMFFELSGLAVAASSKGAATIDVLGLNRNSLVIQRIKKLNNLKHLLSGLEVELGNPKTYRNIAKATNELLTYIDSLTDSHSEHAGFVRSAIAPVYLYLKNRELNFKLTPYLRSSDSKVHNNYTSTLRYVSSIKIKSFMGINELNISLDSENKDLVLIGPNGCGKTSVLRALSFCLMDLSQRKKFYLMNKKAFREGGYIEIGFNDDRSKVRADFVKNKAPSIFGEYESLSYIGIGSHRLYLQNGAYRKPALRSCLSLMFPYDFLSNAHYWFALKKNVNDLDFEMICSFIKPVMGLEEISRSNGNLFLKRIGSEVEEFSDQSDGFKSVISIILEIILNLYGKGVDLKEVEAVVAIDEIENHLHPKWKREVCDLLKAVFPKVQFVITTHDPLILNTIDSKVFIFNGNSNSGFFGKSSPVGKTTDEVLADQYFGLNSTTDKKTEEIYSSYLLELSRFEKDRKKIDSLEDELRSRIPSFAITSLERLAHQVVSKHVQNGHIDYDKIFSGFEDLIKAQI